MILYNATVTPSDHPRVGMIPNPILWPDSAPRTTQPSDVNIGAAIEAAGSCVFHFLDDSHGLDFAGQAQLIYRISKVSGLPITVYGLPGSTAARNLILPWLSSYADEIWTVAGAYARTLVWGPKLRKARPLAAYVDAICPSLYFTEDMNGLVSDKIDPFAAWSLVAEQAISAARYVSTMAGDKPIYPFLFLQAGLGVTPQQILNFLDLRGVDGAIIWGDSAMNEVLVG